MKSANDIFPDIQEVTRTRLNIRLVRFWWLMRWDYELKKPVYRVLVGNFVGEHSRAVLVDTTLRGARTTLWVDKRNVIPS